MIFMRLLVSYAKDKKALIFMLSLSIEEIVYLQIIKDYI